MSRRFGRNQRRKLREEVARLEHVATEHYRGKVSALERAREADDQARMRSAATLADERKVRGLPDTIRVDLSEFRDVVMMRRQVMAEVRDRRFGTVTGAYDISDRELALKRSEHERIMFVATVSTTISEFLFERMVKELGR